MNTVNIKENGMSLNTNFWFVEKDDVPFAIERRGGAVFRMVGRDMEKWSEVTDSDNRCRIMSNSSKISESEALLLADELAADIAVLR